MRCRSGWASNAQALAVGPHRRPARRSLEDQRLSAARVELLLKA
jgi:hypothetical protein